MSIQQNITSRHEVEQLFNAMLDLIRPDFKQLTVDQRKRFLEIAHDRFAERLDLPCCEKNRPLPMAEAMKPAVWATDTTVDEAISELMEIIELCDSVPDRGRDFADSVAEGARSMIAKLERTGWVTKDQQRAIGNWHDGVMAWVER